ncbi:MAG: hypothetical protein LUH22_17930 [Bacteroides sp.]|nr:hypothetical protein [Bacteroides sp.]
MAHYFAVDFSVHFYGNQLITSIYAFGIAILRYSVLLNLNMFFMNENQISHIKNRLATDKIGSLVARYSIPSTIAFVFFSIQAIVDGIIVGNFLGADAIASVSLILPAYTLPSSIALVIAMGHRHK